MLKSRTKEILLLLQHYRVRWVPAIFYKGTNNKHRYVNGQNVIILEINNSGDHCLLNIPISFTFNPSIYTMKQSYIHIPTLIPNLTYHHQIQVECIDSNGIADDIRIFVLNPHSSLPLISAIVNMPTALIDFE